MSDSHFSLDRLIAHRGLQSSYPENTALSLRKAVEKGAKYIELDIQFSSDDLPIIYHDDNLNRVSGHRGNVSEFTRQQLLSIPAHEPDRLGNAFISEKIAPLDALVDILIAHPQVTAFVEIKEQSIDHCGRDTMLKAVQTILEPVKRQAVIISYDYQLVSAAKNKQWPTVGVVLKQWQDLFSDAVRLIKSEYIFIDYRIIPDVLDNIDCNEVNLVAYEVGNRHLGHELIAKGFSMLETFELENLMAGDKDKEKIKIFST